ncbi:hypothetical protein SAY86_018758 [Trapa natans]|uniref:SAM domain-containing protein n=1 Tax=Trapa natans TaxID=22666 RepID=A0AAN7LNG7_TRANT|nr:hypothetical protein SAY86_018758 [Trapa natans]
MGNIGSNGWHPVVGYRDPRTREAEWTPPLHSTTRGAVTSSIIHKDVFYTDGQVVSVHYLPRSLSLSELLLLGCRKFTLDSFPRYFIWEMNKGHPPEPLDFFIWTVEDVGLWLEEINLGNYREIFRENGVNGEYLESMSIFTTEQILRFIRRCHMKWGDFITLCKELRRIKVACLKGEQRIRRPWWAPSCLSIVFMKVAKRSRQSRVVSLKLES